MYLKKSRVKKLYIIKKRIIGQKQINLKSTVLLNSLNSACFFEILFFLTDASFFYTRMRVFRRATRDSLVERYISRKGGNIAQIAAS